MEKPRPSTLAWLALGVGVSAYELTCPNGETMTEGFRDGMKTKVGKTALTAATLITAGHLIHALPDRYDPFEQGLSKVRRRVANKIYKAIIDTEQNLLSEQGEA